MQRPSLEFKEAGEDILFSLLVESGISKDEIHPSLNPILGISYKIGEIDFSYEQLEKFYAKGILRKIGQKSFIACPICNSNIINVKLVCPNCKSQSLERKEFLIHYECNYIEEVAKFQKGDNYVCPKCNKTLKKVGIDYGNPGNFYKCSNCGEIVQYPLILFECLNNHNFKLDEAELVSYPVYKVSEITITPFSLNVIRKLREYYRRERPNFDLKSPAIVNLEKEVYIFPLKITNVLNNKTIFIDFLLSPDTIEKFGLKLLKLAKLKDIKVLIIIKDVTIDPNLFNPFRLKFINVNDLNEENILKILINEIEENITK